MTDLGGFEVLDSRGRPTVKAFCVLDGEFYGAASVPSGASTGSSEALELRDGDPLRYEGQGCLRAVSNIRTAMHQRFVGTNIDNQFELDSRLKDIDGTADKSLLGANAMLAVSIAHARAAAGASGLALYRYFAELAGNDDIALPLPMVNLFSGGRHAGNQVAIQDVLVVPTSAGTYGEALSRVAGVYMRAVDLVANRYGYRWLTADEGGLAPGFSSSEAMIADAARAITDSGLKLGTEMGISIDVAATQFRSANGSYQLDDQKLSGDRLVSVLSEWVSHYQLLSVEDGLDEEDWVHWTMLRSRLNAGCLVVGDDLLCTNPSRISRAIDQNACDALLLKINQIGTVSEALQALLLARDAGWRIIASARSGETEDDWLADLAVGWGADLIKVGSITQSDRTSKHNRLLELESTHPAMGLRSFPFL